MEANADRIVPISTDIAFKWGYVQGRLKTVGTPMPSIDSLIACSALAHGMTLATRNVKDMERSGVEIFNPWEASFALQLFARSELKGLSKRLQRKARFAPPLEPQEVIRTREGPSMPDQILLDDTGEPFLDQFSADGFVDCAFRIAEISTSAKAHSLLLTASHRGTRVGLRVVVMRGLQGGFDSEMELVRDRVYRPAVQFLRLGPESDALIGTLAELYGIGREARQMADMKAFTGILLHQGDVDMEVEAVRIKLFGCDSDEEIERDEYFESFFNLDLRYGYVFWNEKDPSYREPLIRGLSARAG